MIDWPGFIIELKKESGLSGAEIARKLDVRPQLISEIETGRSKNPGSDFLLKLIDRMKLNPEFLTGNGPMFLSETYLREKPSNGNGKENPRRNLEGKGVPYYDIEATAHIAEILSDGVKEPEFYVDFQPFNDCTALLSVFGNSMSPAIQSGEIIAVKEIKDFDVILWGEIYLIISHQNDLRTVKTVHQHDDDSKIILRSINPDFKGDTVIPKDSIIKMFFVKGKISRNYI